MIHLVTANVRSWVHSPRVARALPLGRLAIAGPLGPHARAGARGCASLRWQPVFSSSASEELASGSGGGAAQLLHACFELDMTDVLSSRLKRSRRVTSSRGNRIALRSPRNRSAIPLRRKWTQPASFILDRARAQLPALQAI